MQPQDADAKKLVDTTDHEKFKKIMGLMDLIDERFSIFDVYPEMDCYLDGKILSVNSDYRGLGIAGKLTEATMDYMREHNIKLFNVMCSSHYSARVMEKMDFHEVFRLDYTDYVVNGEQVLCPEKPHVAARILVKEVN